MRKYLYLILMLVIAAPLWGADGAAVTYSVDGQPYEGYFISPGPEAPLVLMIHDWDGLTDYEVKRARMLADAGYAVFALEWMNSPAWPKSSRRPVCPTK